MCRHSSFDGGLDHFDGVVDLGGARALVRDSVVDSYGGPGSVELADEAMLVTSELVTNSIRAGAQTIRVEVRAHTTCLDISVFDEAPGLPVPQNAALGDSHGRGLVIVACLAERWEVRLVSGGKQMWVRLHVPQNAAGAGAGAGAACLAGWEQDLDFPSTTSTHLPLTVRAIPTTPGAVTAP